MSINRLVYEREPDFWELDNNVNANISSDLAYNIYDYAPSSKSTKIYNEEE